MAKLVYGNTAGTQGVSKQLIIGLGYYYALWYSLVGGLGWYHCSCPVRSSSSKCIRQRGNHRLFGFADDSHVLAQVKQSIIIVSCKAWVAITSNFLPCKRQDIQSREYNTLVHCVHWYGKQHKNTFYTTGLLVL